MKKKCILLTVAAGLLSLSCIGQVTSVAGTPDQVNVSPSTGNVALSLPQDIATTSNVQFYRIGLGAASDGGSIVGINTPIAAASSGNGFGINLSTTASSDITGGVYGYRSALSTQAAAFSIVNLRHFIAEQNTIGSGSAVTNQIGFEVENTLIGAAHNYGFKGNIPAGAGRWNLYMNGTALNYLNGNTLIGTTTNNGNKLQVNGSTTITGVLAIGTTDTQGYKLAVNGNMIAESVKVKLNTSWPDYVFHKNYSLRPLSDVEQYIKTNEHLPGIPSAKEVREEGLNLGEMNAKLLQKIEELTLYLIKQDKNQEALVNEVKELKAEINQLKSEP